MAKLAGFRRTLYRVLAVKHGARTCVVVDGCMSDSLRPALYGRRYHIERAGVPVVVGTERADLGRRS